MFIGIEENDPPFLAMFVFVIKYVNIRAPEISCFFFVFSLQYLFQNSISLKDSNLYSSTFLLQPACFIQ